MKVNIGPTTYGKFNLNFQKWLMRRRYGCSWWDKEPTRFESFLGKIDKTWNNFVAEKYKRRVKVKIEPHDIWDLDHTLALIIHPALLKFKEEDDHIHFIRNEDAPESLASPDNSNLDDKNERLRWEWALDEMIYAFESTILHGNGVEINEERQKRGLILFGKYFRGLWS